jgi:glutaredoxin-like protein
MALLPDRDRETVRTHLAGLTRPVTILFFTQTVGAPESVHTARQVLDEVASLGDLITLEEVNVVLEKERAALYGIDHIPAAVLLADGADTRMRFLGAPAGYEFMSLVEAVVLAGTGSSGLSPAAQALIAGQVTVATHVQVFVTPSCVYCPRAVTLAHRMAVESPLITATCVDASEFTDLSRKYRVNGVPKTVVNDSIEFLGALPEEEFVRAALGIEAAPVDAVPE